MKRTRAKYARVKLRDNLDRMPKVIYPTKSFFKLNIQRF